MFYFIILILLIVSFVLALKSLKSIGDKPKISEVKKSLDKNRIVFQSHSSSE